MGRQRKQAPLSPFILLRSNKTTGPFVTLYIAPEELEYTNFCILIADCSKPKLRQEKRDRHSCFLIADCSKPESRQYLRFDDFLQRITIIAFYFCCFNDILHWNPSRITHDANPLRSICTIRIFSK